MIKVLKDYLRKLLFKDKRMKAKLGSGARFKAGVKKIEKEGVSEKGAKAIMANAGRKKYGSKKMESMAKAGRKK